MNIVTYENTVRIDDTAIPKNGFIVRKLANVVRLDYLNTSETIDIRLANTFIDGVQATSLEQIFEYFIEQGFTNGGVTSEWVTEQIINAQLEGEEIDLSIYAKKTDLNPLNSNITTLQNGKVDKTTYNSYISTNDTNVTNLQNNKLNSVLFNSYKSTTDAELLRLDSVKLNISDWTPYKNKVDALNTQTELNLQFAQIAESIRELDEEKVNRNELDNTYVNYTTFDNQNDLNAFNFATKTQLNNYVLLSQLGDFGSLKVYTTQVNAVSGVWECTFPSGKFTNPPFVIAVALNDDSTSKNRANFASLDRGTTATQCKGIAKSCVSGGVLVAMEMGNTDCPVNIIAIGV